MCSSDLTISTICQSQDPAIIHMKDPSVYGASNGDTVLMFCTHPYCWSSSNTAFTVRAADQPEFSHPNVDCFPRGPTWDVAITRGTAIVDVPRIGPFQEQQVSLLFFDGGESLRNLEEHQTAVNRPRGYSCEELGGVAYVVDGDFQNIVRLSRVSPLFVSPYGTGFVARWPAVVPPQSTCDKLVGLQDLMATIAEITDTKLAADEAPDSISMLPLLTDPATKATRTSMAFEATRARAIRVGSWKLALCPGSGCEGRFGNAPPREQAWRDAVKRFGRTPRSHAELQQAPFLQLFNLDRDPGEANNLAADQPARVRQMIALLETQITSGRSTPGSSLTNENQNIKLFSAVPAFVWKAVP